MNKQYKIKFRMDEQMCMALQMKIKINQEKGRNANKS